jgi:hypothetical protein
MKDHYYLKRIRVLINLFYNDQINSDNCPKGIIYNLPAQILSKEKWGDLLRNFHPSPLMENA